VDDDEEEDDDVLDVDGVDAVELADEEPDAASLPPEAAVPELAPSLLAAADPDDVEAPPLRLSVL
jgi:hypothetical protein